MKRLIDRVIFSIGTVLISIGFALFNLYWLIKDLFNDKKFL